jgi:hypothetical protein
METTDLAAEQPEIVGKMRAFMAAAHVPSPNWSANPPAKNAKSQ